MKYEFSLPGIGNGFPLAAVVTTPKIAALLGQALHFNTYGGNPMASAVGISVLEVIEEEQLQKNSLEVGTYFLKSLAKLRERFEIIGDVRGKGLMIGVEMVSDRAARTPLSAPHVAEIWETCKDMGVLFGRGGLNGNVSRNSTVFMGLKSFWLNFKEVIDIFNFIFSIFRFSSIKYIFLSNISNQLKLACN